MAIYAEASSPESASVSFSIIHGLVVVLKAKQCLLSALICAVMLQAIAGLASASPADVYIAVKDAEGNYVYNSACPNRPRVQWNNVHLYVYNATGDQVVSSGSLGCNISVSLPEGQYRFEVIGRKDPDQSYWTLYNRAMDVFNDTTYYLSSDEMAMVAFYVKDAESLFLYGSRSEGCPVPARNQWNNLRLYVYDDMGNIVQSSGHVGCRISFALKDGTYRILVNGNKDSDQGNWVLYNKTISVSGGNVYNLSTSDMALIGFVAQDAELLFLYGSRSEGCSAPQRQQWNNLWLYAYDSSGNLVQSSSHIGCRTTLALNDGSHRIVVAGRKDPDQGSMVLYNKTITVSEGNVYNLTRKDMAMVSFTPIDAEGYYLFGSRSEGCSAPSRMQWNNLWLYAYDSSGNLVQSSGHIGCRSSLGLTNGTYRIVVSGNKDPDQSFLTIYNKTITVAEGGLYNLTTLDMALIGMTIQDIDDYYLFGSRSEACSASNRIQWNNLRVYVYDTFGNTLQSTSHIGCRTTFGLNDGTYRILVNGNRDPDQGNWVLYDKVVTVQDNRLYKLNTMDMARVGVVVTDNSSNHLFGSRSEGCPLLPRLQWNNIIIYAYNSSGDLVQSSSHLGCKTYFGLKEGIHNISVWANPTSGSSYLRASRLDYFEEHEKCVFNVNIEEGTIDRNCTGPTTFVINTINNTSTASIPGSGIDFSASLTNLVYYAGNFSFGIEGLPASWYTFSPGGMSLAGSETRGFNLSIQVPNDCATVGLHDFNITAYSPERSETHKLGLSLDIVANPAISSLMPPNNTYQRPRLIVRWDTDVFSDSKVYYREKGSGPFSMVAGADGRHHSIFMGWLPGNRIYEFYVQSSTACGSSTSGMREFFYDNKTKYLLFYESFDNMSTISNNSGTLLGTPAFEPGVKNDAFNFSGNKRVYYPMIGNINVSNGTIEFWVKTPPGNGYGFWDIGTLQYANSWGIFKNSNFLIMEVKNRYNNFDQAWSSNPFIYDGEWHFVAAPFERIGTTTYFKACLDGVCKSSYDGITGQSYPNENGVFNVGWCGWYGYSQSVIDEFRIYNYAKSDEEIKNDYYGQHSWDRKPCNRTKPDSTGPVKVNCTGLYVNDEPFTVKGVGYQPIPIGKTATSLADKQEMYDDIDIRNRDFKLLRQMNANTVRTWGEVMNMTWLDDLYNNGVDPIYVIMGFWINCGENYGDPAIRQGYINSFTSYVQQYKDHPAVLAWGLGNENNLAYCSSSTYVDDFYNLTNELAGVAYQIEGSDYHPVGIINGDLGFLGVEYFGSDDARLNNTDFWGINVYPGASFGNWFDAYASLSGKPMLITEYGIDALNHTSGTEYEDVHAAWVVGQWREINASNVTIGSTLMAYSDEWWKAGNPSAHNNGGYATDRHPDGYSNEEWWGVMRTVDNGTGADIMQPRQAYYSLRNEWCDTGSVNGDVNGDGTVNIFDLAAVGIAYGSSPGDANWNPAADLTGDGGIDIFDLATVGLNYGRTC
jgi:hypothetical protein